MLYIDSLDIGGSAVYIDIHSVERSADGMRICGTLGDGLYEGEVLIETGALSDVTFADTWLGGAGFRDFLERCDLERLRQALLATVGTISFSARH
ncbi:MAG: hypothetical protein JRE16_06675 [Deltaproteobacteria bacterium]|jgi:hypothetical protein|nr:hypothetical protein [Deltaproteobacteria bacterium]MBW2519366.1 hypothetical protein [Deltaproteobacteria bacterium]